MFLMYRSPVLGFTVVVKADSGCSPSNSFLSEAGNLIGVSGCPDGAGSAFVSSALGTPNSAFIGACMSCLFNSFAMFACTPLLEKNFLVRNPPTDAGLPPDNTTQSVRLIPFSPCCPISWSPSSLIINLDF